MQKTATKLLPIAKVVKSFGADGELVVRYIPDAPEDINEKKPVFLYFEELPVPFFIESVKSRGNNQEVIRLQGIESEKDVEEILGMTVYIEQSKKKQKSKSNNSDIFDPKNLVGFVLYNPAGEYIGEVTEFNDYPGNPCLSFVTEDGNEHLVPIHDDLILGMDEEKELLVVELPIGLLDL
jgi:16S rRNA processing protein RimM